MSVVRYYVADLVTGQVLETLPLTGEVSKAIGEVSTVQWSVAIADQRMPADWLHLLQPVKTMVVAEWNGKLIQGWVIVNLTVGEPLLEINGASLERLFEKVHMRTAEWFNVDPNQIAAEIIGQVMVPQGGWEVEWALSGHRTDAWYDVGDAVTVKSALDTISASEFGPRWLVEVEWVPGQEGYRVRKKVRIAEEFGTYRPEARFTGQMINSYSWTNDWSGDFAALHVWGTIDGVSGYISQPYTSAKMQRGWHPWEAFVSFTNIDRDEQLETRAAAALKERENGARVWSVVCHLDEAPELQRDWFIGDTATLVVEPGQYDPIGGELAARVEGWILDDGARTITPLLYQEAAVD